MSERSYQEEIEHGTGQHYVPKRQLDEARAEAARLREALREIANLNDATEYHDTALETTQDETKRIALNALRNVSDLRAALGDTSDE